MNLLLNIDLTVVVTCIAMLGAEKLFDIDSDAWQTFGGLLIIAVFVMTFILVINWIWS